jgi:cell division protein FtsB
MLLLRCERMMALSEKEEGAMHTFDKLAQEIYRQKQVMDMLQEENKELHRQLADLRDGRGIFVLIEGKRYPLRSLKEIVREEGQMTHS